MTAEIVIPKLVEFAWNRELPKQMDEVTTLTRMQIPSRRHYVYSFDLSNSVPTDLSAPGMKELIKPTACQSLRPLFEGDVRLVSYLYRVHGQIITVDFARRTAEGARCGGFGVVGYRGREPSSVVSLSETTPSPAFAKGFGGQAQSFDRLRIRETTFALRPS